MPVEAMPTARRSREAGLIKPTSTPRYLFGCVIFAVSDQLIQLAQKQADWITSEDPLSL